MNHLLIEKIVHAVLYEGYILYPYRKSTKNNHRWTFGSLFPKTYCDAARNLEPFAAQTQCLLRSPANTPISLKIQFLHLIDRQPATYAPDGTLQPTDQIELANKRYQHWQEALERTVPLEIDLAQPSQKTTFHFPADKTIEHLYDEQNRPVAALIRTRSALQGAIQITITPHPNNLYQLTARVENHTPFDPASSRLARDSALPSAMASTHFILTATAAEFISLIDPPPDLAPLASQCTNTGVWPVLVGEPGATDALLASPIILYDYPQIAPESPGDLFDGGEIDEILSLRILTLTDDEKRSVQDLDPHAANMLKRTQALARNQLLQLHGTMRGPKKLEVVHVKNAELRTGDRVRLQPNGRADAFDIILRGKTAVIVAIEQDYENRIHLAVTIEDDPGADIGQAGKIGHRFYYRPDEVQPLPPIPSEQEAQLE